MKTGRNKMNNKCGPERRGRMLVKIKRKCHEKTNASQESILLNSQLCIFKDFQRLPSS